MTPAAALSDRSRLAVEVVAWTVAIACLLAILAVTSLSLFGPAVARLCRNLARVPKAEDLLLDRHWRAPAQTGTPASGPPPCLIPRRVAG